jgi:hypothetical protein
MIQSKGVPFDKRSKETMTYISSLVGATSEVDESTLTRVDYVRIKITARDIAKVLAKAKGAIIPFLYGFYYEREVQMGPNDEGATVLVVNDTSGDIPPFPKKPRTVGQTNNQPQLQIEGVSEPKDKGAHDIVKSLFLLSQLGMEHKSAPPKISVEKNEGQPKLLADAQKFRYKANAYELSILNSQQEESA